jgi:hypothetical protein
VCALLAFAGPRPADLSAQGATAVFISEVYPAGSGNGTYAADWFEITNPGPFPVDITGWTIDDNSNASASAVPLRGVTTIPPGRSAVFFEGAANGSTDAAILASFSMAWFGSATPPPGVLIGAYGGSGVGLGNGGDAVNLFDAGGSRATGIAFGATTAGFTFDNAAGLGSTTLPLPVVSTASVVGVNHGHGYLPGHPSMHPLLVLSGAGIAAGRSLGHVRNVDVAPTIAALLGLSLHDVDGRILRTH